MRAGDILNFHLRSPAAPEGEPHTARIAAVLCRVSEPAETGARELLVVHTQAGGYLVRERTYLDLGRHRRSLAPPDWRVYEDLVALRRSLSLADELERRTLERIDRWAEFADAVEV